MTLDASSAPRRAEIAFLVEEDYHGQGIAGRILKHLACIAREKGVTQFEADVLPQNKAMLAVFARSGLSMQQTPGDGSVHLTLSLPPVGLSLTPGTPCECLPLPGSSNATPCS